MDGQVVSDGELNVSGELFLANWPDKTKYLDERNSFVERQRSGVKKQLVEAGYSPELVGDMAMVVCRGVYLFDLMCDVLKVKDKIETRLTWNTNLHVKTRGQTSFYIGVEGEPDSEEAKPVGVLLGLARAGETLVLNRSVVTMNLEEIRSEVASALLYQRRASEAYLGERVGEDMRMEFLETLGVRTERCVVEEVAHLLYVARVFKSSGGIMRFLEQMVDYSQHLPGDETLIKIDTFEEAELRRAKYDNKDVEAKADLLVTMFTNKYYPDYRGGD